MKTKLLTLGILALAIISCTSGDKKADQSLIKDGASNEYVATNADSINLYNSKLGLLSTQKVEKVKLIDELSEQRDSLKAVLTQLEVSMKAINEKKLNPGIEGVNRKLDELKGQKENLQEQTSLQKKEVALALKKIEILNEEKNVYQEQKKALYDKGAPPAAFKNVDTLLNSINSKILIQNDVVKNINRSVADAEEQIIRISGQRDALSKKIRSNYDTQLIITEFNADEKVRLEEQISKINDILNTLLSEKSNLDTDYKLLAAKISNLDTPLTTDKALEDDGVLNKEEKSGKSGLAFIIIVTIGLIMGALYMIGKRRSNRVNHKKK
ncbi:hypothetical protein [Mariniflexile sp.]|uniref:hypothetical protein n=1 Tax=Mariniflexile sp. TaxID=1979402 RepID=UPI0035651206